MQKNRLQAHGLTTQQMKEVQVKQINGEESEMMTGNTKAGKEYNDGEGYQFPVHEQDIVHAEFEIEEWSRGKKTSTPYIQKFNVRNFNEAVKNNFYAGYKVVILHDPRTPAEKKNVQQQTSDGGGQVKGVGTDVEPVTSDKPEWYKTAAWKNENKDSIAEKYREVVGSEPDSSMTKAQMIEFIESEIAD